MLGRSQKGGGGPLLRGIASPGSATSGGCQVNDMVSDVVNDNVNGIEQHCLLFSIQQSDDQAPGEMA